MSEEVINRHVNYSLTESEEKDLMSLASLFPSMEPDMLLKTLRDYHGDINASIDALIALGDSQESVAIKTDSNGLSEKEKEHLLRLMNIFPHIQENELLHTLRKLNNDLKMTIEHLSKDDLGENLYPEFLSAPPLNESFNPYYPEKYPSNNDSKVVPDLHLEQEQENPIEVKSKHGSEDLGRAFNEVTLYVENLRSQIDQKNETIEKQNAELETVQTELTQCQKTIEEQVDTINKQQTEMTLLRKRISELSEVIKYSKTKKDIEEAVQNFNLEEKIKEMVKNLVQDINK